MLIVGLFEFGGHFEFHQLEIFQEASSPETLQFVYYCSNGVAILSGFHDIPQYQACRGE